MEPTIIFFNNEWFVMIFYEGSPYHLGACKTKEQALSQLADYQLADCEGRAS